MSRPSKPTVQVLLMSDDLAFSQNLTEEAAGRGVEINTFGTLAELGSIAYLGNYDVLLADTLRGPLNGLEIAQYAAAFFPGLPVLLSANDAAHKRLEELPVSVLGTFSKDRCMSRLIEQILQLDRTSPARHPRPVKRPLFGTI